MSHQLNRRESSFSNMVAVPYMLNTDKIDIRYRKKPDKQRFEAKLDIPSNRIRLKTKKIDNSLENITYLVSEEVEDISSKRVRVRAVTGDIKSHWVEYKELPIEKKNSSTRVRIRGVADTFARIRGKYSYSNIVSHDIDLFNVLSDVLDVALMATEQVDFAYDFLVKDLIINDLLDKDPSLAKLLDSIEIKEYSLEELLMYLSTTSNSISEEKSLEAIEFVEAGRSTAEKQIHEFFMSKSKEIADIMQMYDIEDDEYKGEVKDKTSQGLLFEVSDLYKKIEDTILPIHFHWSVDGEEHLSTGDEAHIRVRDFSIQEDFLPMIKETYRNIIKDFAAVNGELAVMERLPYEIEESLFNDFTADLIELVTLMALEEDLDALVDLEFKDSMVGMSPVKENISLIRHVEDVETLLYYLYDKYMNLIEEIETKYSIDLDFKDSKESIIYEVFVGLYTRLLEESTSYSLQDIAKTHGSILPYMNESLGVQVDSQTINVQTYGKQAKEELAIEIISLTKQDKALEFIHNNLEEIHSIIEESTYTIDAHKYMYEEDIKAGIQEILLRNKTEEVGLISEEIFAEVREIALVIARLKDFYWEKKEVAFKEAPLRLINPHKKDTFTTLLEELERKNTICQDIEDRTFIVRDAKESMVYSTGDKGDVPLGLFVLGRDRLGFRHQNEEGFNEKSRENGDIDSKN